MNGLQINTTYRSNVYTHSLQNILGVCSLFGYANYSCDIRVNYYLFRVNTCNYSDLIVCIIQKKCPFKTRTKYFINYYFTRTRRNLIL